MQCQQFFGNDLSLLPNGTIQLSSGESLAQQAIIRRLLTNPGTYFWHPEYGAGIGRFVGEILSGANLDNITNLITSQILMEKTVANFPRPQITFSFSEAGNNILQCSIVYYSSSTNSPQSITFPVN
jgi:hypothetical protein